MDQTSNRLKAVVLISGGMDSCVTAAIASRSYHIAALHVSYGQPTERRELQSFHAVADYFGASERLAVPLEHFRLIGGSSLTDSRIPIHDANLTSREIPNTYVPFRNAHFLSIATSWAEVLGARKIFIGAVWEDSSGYPDCRPEYYEAFNKVIRAGTRPTTDIAIETPLIYLAKRDIVKRGAALNAPFHLTWAWYRGWGRGCGACGGWALGLRAFRQGGVGDALAN